MPGVVLRVSNTRVFVPFSRSTYLFVMVAMPLIRCMMFNIRRSVCNRLLTRPVTIMATSPGFTCVPSCMNTSTFMSGSKRRNTSFAISIPANTPSSLMSNLDFPMASAGIQQSVVWSPSPMSSAKAKSIKRSFNSSTDNIFPILLMYS